jgi:hypothetical protein
LWLAYFRRANRIRPRLAPRCEIRPWKVRQQWFRVEDGNGVATLKAPGKGQPGYPQLTSICCKPSDAFDKWIDQWHAHNIGSGNADAPKSLRSLYTAMPIIVDESVRSRRALHFVERLE